LYIKTIALHTLNLKGNGVKLQNTSEFGKNTETLALKYGLIAKMRC